MQRVFRGHLGRTVARMRELEQERAYSAEALMNACATDIARVGGDIVVDWIQGIFVQRWPSFCLLFGRRKQKTKRRNIWPPSVTRYSFEKSAGVDKQAMLQLPFPRPAFFGLIALSLVIDD